MKQIGIIRRLDTLNRLVIPREFCNKIQIGAGSPMEMFLNDNDEVLLRKHKTCIASSLNYIKDIVNVFILHTKQIVVIADDKKNTIYATDNYVAKEANANSQTFLSLPNNNVELNKANCPYTYYHLETIKDSFDLKLGYLIVFSNNPIENKKNIEYLTSLINKKISV